MTETIRRLLGFARRAPGPASRVDLYEVAREGIKLLEPLARQKSIKLELRDSGDAACVAGQHSEVEQIVTNLVTNAIDSIEGGGAVNVDISTLPGRSLSRPVRADAVFHRLAIRDSGRGIPDAELARLFEPFYTTKAAGRGTGLGLWIVDGIVRDQRGWIEVESRLGKGTSFCVYLPAAET
jgi:signal transduction histidine kinase